MSQLQSLFDGDIPGDPLEILEEVITSHNWSYERHSETEVVIDHNHPLAGKALHFAIKVLDVE